MILGRKKEKSGVFVRNCTVQVLSDKEYTIFQFLIKL